MNPEAVKKNPSALHNTEFKYLQRKTMLEGGRPTECDYCWRIEDSSNKSISDRAYKSHDSWALPHMEAIKSTKWNTPVNPSYVELAFSSACNFKCAYCNPAVSSRWMQDVVKDGAYELTRGNQYFNSNYIRELKTTLAKTEDSNVFVKAFWEWWPELVKTMSVFRITGGEPLMSPNTGRVLDFLEKNPHPNLEFGLNTNLGVAEKIVAKTARQVRAIIDKKHISRFRLYTSLDTWGPQAEYIRDGLNLDLFKKNFDSFLQKAFPIQTTFMVTFNALSFAHFVDFLKFVMDRRKYLREELKNGNEIFIDISYLRDPSFLAANIVTPDLIAKGDAIVSFMKSNAVEDVIDGFYPFEIQKMERLMAWVKAPQDARFVAIQRADFHAFITEYDRRREKHFSTTFPVYAGFMKTCSNSKWITLDAPKLN